MPEIGVLTRTYFAEGQVADCPRRHMRIKWTLFLRQLFMQRHTIIASVTQWDILIMIQNIDIYLRQIIWTTM